MRTIVDAITGSGATDEQLTVLNDGELSWRELHARARRACATLRAHGITRGSRVGLLGETSIDLVAALQAVWLCGAAVTVLSPPRRGDYSAIEAVIADAGLDVVLADEPMALSVKVLVLQTLFVGEPAGVALPEPGDLAILQYTSGSTSDPRGIAVTHAQLASNLCAIEAAFDRSDGLPVRMASWLPLFHDMGLIGFLCLPMAWGFPLVLQPPSAFARRPSSWFQTISGYAISVTGGPNFAFRMMTRLLEGGFTADLRTLRFVLCGGEPIDATTMAAFTAVARNCGFDPGALVAAYGLAEATLAVSIASPGTGIQLDDFQGRRLVKLGRAVSRTHIRIVHPDSREPLADREPGVIEVAGPAVTGDGWLDTGDLGYLTEGELVVCGRRKEVLFAAGRNVYPQDIEAIMVTLPDVKNVAAFGVPGADGDRLIVAVEARGPVARKQIATMITELAGITPADIVTLPPGRLPRTSSGKLRRAELRRRYLEGEM